MRGHRNVDYVADDIVDTWNLGHVVQHRQIAEYSGRLQRFEIFRGILINLTYGRLS